jgi:hypothetical protein
MLLRKQGSFNKMELLLRDAQEQLEAAQDIGMLGATYKEWANFYGLQAQQATHNLDSKRAYYLDQMQEALYQAEALTNTQQSPLLRVNAFMTKAELYLEHGMDIDQSRLLESAEICLRYGYGGQAKHILKLPHVDQFLPQELLLQLRKHFLQRMKEDGKSGW